MNENDIELIVNITYTATGRRLWQCKLKGISRLDQAYEILSSNTYLIKAIEGLKDIVLSKLHNYEIFKESIREEGLITPLTLAQITELTLIYNDFARYLKDTLKEEEHVI